MNAMFIIYIGLYALFLRKITFAIMTRGCKGYGGIVSFIKVKTSQICAYSD